MRGQITPVSYPSGHREQGLEPGGWNWKGFRVIRELAGLKSVNRELEIKIKP